MKILRSIGPCLFFFVCESILFVFVCFSDTAFMYIIGLLGGLRLYQIRHHDVVINGHLAYASFAVVIFTSVIGVVSVAFSRFATSL